MVRTYKRKTDRQYRDYTDETLVKALTEIANGSSTIRKASIKYQIPSSTLHNKMHHKHDRPFGGPTALTSAEEEELAGSLAACADYGFALTSNEIKMLVKYYLESMDRQCERFKDGVPGDDWLRGFLKRNESRIGRKITISRRRSHHDVNKDVSESAQIAPSINLSSTLIEFLQERKFAVDNAGTSMVHVMPRKSDVYEVDAVANGSCDEDGSVEEAKFISCADDVSTTDADESKCEQIRKASHARSTSADDVGSSTSCHSDVDQVPDTDDDRASKAEERYCSGCGTNEIWIRCVNCGNWSHQACASDAGICVMCK